MDRLESGAYTSLRLLHAKENWLLEYHHHSVSATLAKEINLCKIRLKRNQVLGNFSILKELKVSCVEMNTSGGVHFF